jgi:hypothetical protein
VIFIFIQIKTTSLALKKQLQDHFELLANRPSFNSDHIEGCDQSNIKSSLIAQGNITWIWGMASLPKTEDIGTSELQMMLYTSATTSGDGFRIRYETTYPEMSGRCLFSNEFLYHLPNVDYTIHGVSFFIGSWKSIIHFTLLFV